MIQAAVMCLLLGPTSVGKTLFLKRLESYSNGTPQDGSMTLNDAPATIPTVGTNLVNVLVGRKHEVTVREVGGCMGPIWQTYYKDCKAVMYIIDISNRLQTSGACIQLLSVLASEKLSKVPVLVILNKIDMPEKMSMDEVDSIFRLRDIINQSTQTVKSVEISAVTGKGLSEVVRWMEQYCCNR